MSDRLYRVWLSAKSGLSPRVIAALLAHFGDPAHIYAAGCEEFLQCAFLQKTHVDALCDKDLAPAEEILHRCAREHIAVLTPEDADYPARLRMIDDPPAVLYVRGRMPDLEGAPGIAIVGTRSCSAYGLIQAAKFGAALAEAGFTVVTGMALGIDGAASRGALRTGKPTAAVFAGGVDLCYPPQNRALMSDILLNGAILSENPPGTPHKGSLFPVRNRILSGLCAATLVIEAPVRSGALITASAALDQGRELFVLPGGVDNPASAGSNALLRQGAAQIALEPMDLVHELSGLLRTMPDAERVRAIYLRESGGVELRTESKEPSAPRKTSRREKSAAPQPEPIPGETPEETERRLQAESDARVDAAFKKAEPAIRAFREANRAKEAKQPEPKSKTNSLLQELTGDEKLVAQAMLQGAKTPDDIIRMSGLSASRALSALTMLEIDGLVSGTATEVRLV